jgi:ectoine hydroxylase-related dioxygenase (phytanoyl-CoA dioxygenase family)
MMMTTPHLSEEQLALLPTEEEVAFYEEHGWYISPKVIPEHIIDAAIQGSERFYRGERDAILTVQQGYSNWRPEDGYGGIRNNEFVSLQNEELRQLALQPIIGAIAARLTRTNQIRLLDDQLVYKPPQDEQSAVGWHSDRAYWATCSSDRLLTAWIPFHDCQVERGPLVMMDGSHRWPDLHHLRFFNQQNLADLAAQLKQQGRPVHTIPMTLQKGQLSFHNCWTVHGSYPNRSSLPRLALAVHLQDRSNQYRSHQTENGQPVHIIDEQFCRKLPNGDPDFSDPTVFPVLWSEEVNWR